jgi:lipopolysaccharide/colanic/teichoic acid biosynthesis glycosyltransferase
MLTNLDELDIAAEESAPPVLKFRRPTQDAAPPSPSRAYLKVRRLVDFTLALGLTLIALPIVMLAALAVKLTSRGRAFYKQTRVGRGGEPFTIYKIRTMVHKCESLTGPRWTIPDDPRITPIGWLLRRTHIDELPQLLNVLKGQMSLIGPRPERPEFVRELAQAIPDYQKRHAVLPGITGLAQVQLAPDTDIESVRRKLVFDLYHIEHMSFWLDARIMVATALHMVGVSFRRLRRLRVVPTVEILAPAPAMAPESRPQQLAA